MFNDARSKRVLFVSHCILNQNSISDGTADCPGTIAYIMEMLRASTVGIVQMPCPELMCLGLDRGNIHGSASPVVEENTRIREMMKQESAVDEIRRLVVHVAAQISEYHRHGFDIRGIVGINRSPSCGVETTSKENREVDGEGVFITALRDALAKKGLSVEFAGIKVLEKEKAVETFHRLLNANRDV